MNKLSVSVITPAYNEEEFIRHNIESVKNQEYDNIEHIIVDDGSTDNTLKIISEYENEYNLICKSKSNEGQTITVNKGFEMAAGDIVIWLNADDVLFSKYAVKAVVREFSQPDPPDLVYGNRVTINERNQIDNIRIPIREFTRERLLRWCFGAFVCMSQEVISNYQLDAEYKYTMDYDFYLRITTDYNNVNYLNELLLGFRVHSEAKSSKFESEFEREGKKCQIEHGQEFDIKYVLLMAYDLFIYHLLKIYAIVHIIHIDNNTDSISFPINSISLPKKIYRQCLFILPIT